MDKIIKNNNYSNAFVQGDEDEDDYIQTRLKMIIISITVIIMILSHHGIIIISYFELAANYKSKG